jgi:hypothetical protein
LKIPNAKMGLVEWLKWWVPEFKPQYNQKKKFYYKSGVANGKLRSKKMLKVNIFSLC